MNDTVNGTAVGAEPTETRDETFKRVAGKRVNRIMGDLTLIEQMAGSPRYQYTLEDVDRMLAAVEAAAERVRQTYTLRATRTKADDARKSFHF